MSVKTSVRFGSALDYFKYNTESPRIDCLQSAFSLKIRLVLISSSAIANHDVVITVRD